MNWIPLTNLEQLESIGDAEGFSVIFKHSTRCSVSLIAKKRFEHDWDSIPESTSVYFLDLISNREVSNTIAQKFSVNHESPQLLLIKNGQCIYETSHGEISAEDLAEQMA
ncbi:MAG: bacillithiol system redox-active protein YtxJ [Bacteroidetes bacterium]|jgi:bacillithiol system protein YtxJ|uniref:bacillithiol system redox-active protein YtxJ n=1 Tax=Daejeonella sp. TaxID=2805397 RepID=UPI004049BFDB|nr:bacillithiol system redox-active protein YtxJ [Bacteroidota bacterium]